MIQNCPSRRTTDLPPNGVSILERVVKRSSVRISSSPLEDNAAGIEPVAFFVGLLELLILGLPAGT